MSEYTHGRDQHAITVGVVSGIVAIATLQWYGLLSWALAVVIVCAKAAYLGFLGADYAKVYTNRRRDRGEIDG